MANTEGRDVVERLRYQLAHSSEWVLTLADLQALLSLLEDLTVVAKAAQDVAFGSPLTVDSGSHEVLRAALARLYDGSSGDA